MPPPVIEDVEILLDRSQYHVDYITATKPTAAHPMVVDEAGEVEVIVHAPAPIATVTILTPTGLEISAATIAGWQGTFHVQPPLVVGPDDGPDMLLWPSAPMPLFATYHVTFNATELGTYTIRAAAEPAASSDAPAFFTVLLQDGVAVSMTAGESTVRTDGEATPAVFVMQDQLPVTGATVGLRARHASGEFTTFAAFDDGQNGDLVADDGVYSASFEPSLVGDWGISAEITGQNRNGHAFKRHAASRVTAIAPCGAFGEGTGSPTWSPHDADNNGYYDGVTFSVVATSGAAGDYRVYFDVLTPWGKTVWLQSDATLGASEPHVFASTPPVTPEQADTLSGVFEVKSMRLIYLGNQGIGECDVRLGDLLTTPAFTPDNFNRLRYAWTLNDEWEYLDTDNDAHGLFNLVKVRVGIQVAKPGLCRYSASRFDRCGRFICFSNPGQATLVEGVLDQQLEFNSPGCKVGEDGIGGPFTMKWISLIFMPAVDLIADYHKAFGKPRELTNGDQPFAWMYHCYFAPQDYNGNGEPDACEILQGTLSDTNGNWIPDDFEPPPCPPACNLADVTSVGGGVCPDGQLTVDDILEFVNAYNDGIGRPGASPCNMADITGIGGPPEPPDGQLTIDDVLAFINAYNDGCPGAEG